MEALNYNIKQIALRLFFALEICLFLFFYFFGAQGLPQLLSFKKQNALLKKDIGNLEQEVSQLRHEISAWHEFPFYKEKFAREELQMGHDTEEIYLYP